MFRDFCSLLNSLQAPHVQLLNILPSYEQVQDFERRLNERGKLTFEHVFQEPLGNFIFRKYLQQKDGVVDRAMFLSDFSIYKSLTSDFARRNTARRMFNHFLAPQAFNHAEGISVFSTDYTEPSPPFLSENSVQLNHPSIDAILVLIETSNCAFDLFDPVAILISKILKENYQKFRSSEHFKYLIRCKSLELKEVGIDMFQILEVIGHGAFSHVNMCMKEDSCMFYAVKVISKKRLLTADMVEAIMAERDFLATVKSRFVLSLNYAVMDAQNIYLVLDLMVGGDLKHFLHNQCFDEAMTRFYAAQIVLGLSHVHHQQIIYRDMKLENVLLDERGNCRISDFGLAVRKDRARGYAGTPGYAAPEVVMGIYYDQMADFFSLGVMIYRILLNRKPFQKPNSNSKAANIFARGEVDANVVNYPPDFSNNNLADATIDFLKKLLRKHPNERLGRNGYDEIKNHPFFEGVDFGMVEAGCVEPPISPRPQHLLPPPSMTMPIVVDSTNKRDAGSSSIEEALPLTNFCYKSKRAVQREVLNIFSSIEQKNPQFFDHLLESGYAQDVLLVKNEDMPPADSNCCIVS